MVIGRLRASRKSISEPFRLTLFRHDHFGHEQVREAYSECVGVRTNALLFLLLLNDRK
jgi:hypothetical protein